MRRYLFEHIMNFRDLGGHPVRSGGSTRFGRIFRSDLPYALTEEEYSRVELLGITDVIDLRSPVEAQERPCAFDGRAGFQYHHCVITALSNVLPEKEEDVAKTYLEMTHVRPVITQIIRIVAEARGGVLYHCSAGKDRTGVISALILMLCGVPDNDIIADYQVSYTYIKPLIDAMLARGIHMPAFIGQSNREYMQGFLEAFRLEYGSVEQYLDLLGITQDEQEAIRYKLLWPRGEAL